ncbi:hypothetical protein BH20CHL6_BH20CHL6_08360 [soil metagenome]|jgi:hypothetical protein
MRNPPTPVLRAVVANIAVAAVGVTLLLAWDVAAPDGADLAAFALFVVTVVVAGSLFTYLWVPLPSGASGRRRRSGWSAVLGFFTSFPVAYLALVAAFDVIRPLL